jgi:uncharacterized protein YjbI with pentapeptide repeats
LTYLNTQKEFVAWINEVDEEFEEKRLQRNSYRFSGGDMLRLNSVSLQNLSIRDKDFECTEFKECLFENCNFLFSHFSSCTLIGCDFVNCTFTWSKFLDVDLIECSFEDCTILGLELSDAILKNTTFLGCSEVLDLSIRGKRDREVLFQKCYLHHMDVEPNGNDDIDILDFSDCFITESSFDRVDFSQSTITDCSLSLNQFSSCTFEFNTLQNGNQTPGNEYNLIDIRTILNSSELDNVVLEELFGIHNPQVKDYFVELTSKLEFQSIFISYSFADKRFANKINNELNKRGILTFLWEKDSPGGKPLKEIMSKGVDSKDRVLFIASENSLKSEACQFELSEGRRKQEKSWETVLFPIHIDDFLFNVNQEQIRPIEKKEEYWKNIEELRRINSISFTNFSNINNVDDRAFNKVLMRLITGLRKE